MMEEKGDALDENEEPEKEEEGRNKRRGRECMKEK